ncbi:hypothetical protein BB559_000849 [Furculomyces boomerangus]|uniref:CWF21 domain-containing protein n=2 Tax=Harpellales TaxID=61421 RepID=A0A2T9Z418_9FUNG|nr:hypothetical protein BB559_000849 [Furculomyces boomerangus]PWA03375.1 hypothetical protein BB558_000458 [Smittium angustum]
MYNGIGLRTTRGTGTSGYVVKNLSQLKPKKSVPSSNFNKTQEFSEVAGSGSLGRRVDEGILEHDRKRQIEVKCLELSDKLEDEGLDSGEIEKRVDAYREKLLLELSSGKTNESSNLKQYETHKQLDLKKKQLEKLKNAFKMPEDYVEGMSFDKDLIELQKQQKKMEYEQKKLSEAKLLLEKLTTETKTTHKRHHSNSSSSSGSSSSDEEQHRKSGRSSKKHESKKTYTDSSDETDSD